MHVLSLRGVCIYTCKQACVYVCDVGSCGANGDGECFHVHLGPENKNGSKTGVGLKVLCPRNN